MRLVMEVEARQRMLQGREIDSEWDRATALALVAASRVQMGAKLAFQIHRKVWVRDVIRLRRRSVQPGRDWRRGGRRGDGDSWGTETHTTETGTEARTKARGVDVGVSVAERVEGDELAKLATEDLGMAAEVME